mmetsp:Transcript_33914/g.95327  ORF Transcript_33914/g.95327 Transcript_33914/m.95327 type:complete len:208 (-) Transcript_33914:758-1381(-)
MLRQVHPAPVEDAGGAAGEVEFIVLCADFVRSSCAGPVEEEDLVHAREQGLRKVTGQAIHDALGALIPRVVPRYHRLHRLRQHRVGVVGLHLAPDGLPPRHVVGPEVGVLDGSDADELEAVGHRLSEPVPRVDLPRRQVQQPLELGHDRRVGRHQLVQQLVALAVEHHPADVPARRQPPDLLVLADRLVEFRDLDSVEALRGHESAL